MIHPEPDDIRAAFVRHIDFPCAADAPPPSSNASPSSGECEVAQGIPLDRGGVFPRPAFVGRMVAWKRIKRAALLLAIALLLAGAAFTLGMALASAPDNVGR